MCFLNLKKMANNSNINSSEINKDVESKLKGDLIGNTVYSESFVIKTLLKFKNVEWDEDFESDLCFLWDMTIENDVCYYLHKLSFPTLVCNVISTQSNPRLLEILIGILGNICILEECAEPNPEVIETVWNHLESDDPLILIQVMRFMQVIAYKSRNKIQFINETVIDKMVFILNNSNNAELILSTMDALCKLTSDKKCDIAFLKRGLIKSSTEAFKTVCETEFEDGANFYKNGHAKSGTAHYLQLLINVSVYLNENCMARFFSDDEVDDVAAEFLKMLTAFLNDDELPFSIAELNFLIDAMMYVCPILEITCERLFCRLMDLFLLVFDGALQNLRDEFDEILCYFISVCDAGNFRHKLLYKKVFEIIKDDNVRSDFNYISNLNLLLSV